MELMKNTLTQTKLKKIQDTFVHDIYDDIKSVPECVDGNHLKTKGIQMESSVSLTCTTLVWQHHSYFVWTHTYTANDDLLSIDNQTLCLRKVDTSYWLHWQQLCETFLMKREISYFCYFFSEGHKNCLLWVHELKYSWYNTGSFMHVQLLYILFYGNPKCDALTK